MAGAASPAAANPKYAGIVVDAKTGNVLYSENADSLRYPASLTKMMTLYLVFESLEKGRINLNTKVPVSANAAAEPPSKLGLRAGSTLTVDQAIKALVTRSANDAATALGEFIGGSETQFARMMTNKARALGMTRTTYRNANGLPNTAQMTTARDQARLGMALRQHFPQYYGYFSTRSFRYGKQNIGNHNRLLGAVRGVDGIKTGYTRASGFNLATSAQADGRSVVGVVLGGTTGRARDAQMTKLINRYLSQASRRGGGNVIAEAGPEPVPMANAEAAQKRLALPESGPVPVVRYEVPYATASAYAAPSGSAASDAVAKQLASVEASVPAPTPVETTSIKQDETAESVDQVTTASTSQPAGWVIQIGVSPSKEMAMELLRTTQGKGGKVLRSATPFAMAFNAESGQVYRARFGGFGDQKEAVNACKALKKKGVGCWASLQ
ncbi:serine hydrolase [Ferirhizobium litorale]